MLSCDSDTDIEDEFFTALALFKSTAKNSGGKLREMLLTTIAKRQKFSNHDIKIPLISSTCENIHETLESKINFNIEQLRSSEDIHYNSMDGENRGDSREIPTISIPDEEFTDFITCKICDGAKIGPFILLECQDCLDTYHPLCHQPPVIDIDVYDPRLVWRCSRCSSINDEITQEISSTLNSLDKNGNKPNDEEATKENNGDASMNTNAIKQQKNYSSMSHNNEKYATLKDSTKEEYCSLGNQLRKRIGSKLTVSRAHMKS